MMHNIINKKESLMKLIDHTPKFDSGHMSAQAIYECYCSYRLILGEEKQTKWMNIQAQAATIILECVELSLHNGLDIPPTDGTSIAAHMSCIQGSFKFVYETSH